MTNNTDPVHVHSPIQDDLTCRRQSTVSDDINVLALIKGKERYIFLFDDEHRADALRTLGRFASNPDLSFSWYDAAVLSQKVRQATKKAAGRRIHQTQSSDLDEFED